MPLTTTQALGLLHSAGDSGFRVPKVFVYVLWAFHRHQNK